MAKGLIVAVATQHAVFVVVGKSGGIGHSGNDGSPSDKITRAEASAIIYRMATGDVDNRQNDLYKDYSTFVDVNSDDWFAGYVGVQGLLHVGGGHVLGDAQLAGQSGHVDLPGSAGELVVAGIRTVLVPA